MFSYVSFKTSYILIILHCTGNAANPFGYIISPDKGVPKITDRPDQQANPMCLWSTEMDLKSNYVCLHIKILFSTISIRWYFCLDKYSALLVLIFFILTFKLL